MAKQKDTQTTRVNILGDEYAIRSDAEPDHVRKLANLIDARMRAISGSSPATSSLKAAILTAIGIADELHDPSQDRRALRLFEDVERRAEQLTKKIDNALNKVKARR